MHADIRWKKGSFPCSPQCIEHCCPLSSPNIKVALPPFLFASHPTGKRNGGNTATPSSFSSHLQFSPPHPEKGQSSPLSFFLFPLLPTGSAVAVYTDHLATYERSVCNFAGFSICQAGHLPFPNYVTEH